MAEEFPGIVLDAIRRAESVRAEQRIVRLARIVARAAEAGPTQNADDTEEFMRIAMELGDRDIVLLQALADADASVPPFFTNDPPGAAHGRTGRANRVWERMDWGECGYHVDDVDSICSKLQSFGLLAPSANMAAANYYIVLRKAHTFLKFVRGRA